MKGSDLLELIKSDTRVKDHLPVIIILEHELKGIIKEERGLYQPDKDTTQLIEIFQSAITIIKNYDNFVQKL